MAPVSIKFFEKEVYFMNGCGLDIEGNNLRKIRTRLGLTITALSKRADVSTKVISQTERLLVDPTLVTKNKILIGLNADVPPFGREWTFKDIFPHG